MIAIIHGNKQLIQEFIDQFQMDRAHDGADIDVAVGDDRPRPKFWCKLLP